LATVAVAYDVSFYSRHLHDTLLTILERLL
jgi:hypothetical protein